MNTAHIERNAITGAESIDIMPSPMSALVEFYSAFNSRNFGLMKQNWSQTEAASMSNPLGGIKRGWNEISAVYRTIFNGPATVYVEFYDYSIHENDTVFLAVGREKGNLSMNGTHIDLAIRTTRIFTFMDGRWKQLHHHGSMDQPALLETYQATLLHTKENNA